MLSNTSTKPPETTLSTSVVDSITVPDNATITTHAACLMLFNSQGDKLEDEEQEELCSAVILVQRYNRKEISVFSD